jgi:hypothetical protein
LSEKREQKLPLAFVEKKKIKLPLAFVEKKKIKLPLAFVEKEKRPKLPLAFVGERPNCRSTLWERKRTKLALALCRSPCETVRSLAMSSISLVGALLPPAMEESQIDSQTTVLEDARSVCLTDPVGAADRKRPHSPVDTAARKRWPFDEAPMRRYAPRQYRDRSGLDACWCPILDQIGKSDTVNLVLVPQHLVPEVQTCARVAVHETPDRCLFGPTYNPDEYLRAAQVLRIRSPVILADLTPCPTLEKVLGKARHLRGNDVYTNNGDSSLHPAYTQWEVDSPEVWAFMSAEVGYPAELAVLSNARVWRI